MEQANDADKSGMDLKTGSDRIRVYGTDSEFYALYQYNKNKTCYVVEKFFHV
jgi:hypothetical protein